MAKYKIKYHKHHQESPMSFWVHHHMDSEIWQQSSKYEPTSPKATGARGYPMLIIDVLGYELRFSSIQEVEHFLAVINKKNMPTSVQLASKRANSTGINNHWLSRLPAKLKPWRNRAKYIPVIEDGLMALKKIYD